MPRGNITQLALSEIEYRIVHREVLGHLRIQLELLIELLGHFHRSADPVGQRFRAADLEQAGLSRHGLLQPVYGLLLFEYQKPPRGGPFTAYCDGRVK